MSTVFPDYPIWYPFTLESVKPGGKDHNEFVQWCTDSASYVEPLDDTLFRLDGSPWGPDLTLTVDLETDTTTPLYRYLRSALSRARRECRD